MQATTNSIIRKNTDYIENSQADRPPDRRYRIRSYNGNSDLCGKQGQFVILNSELGKLGLGCQGDYTQPSYADALSRIEHAAAVTGKVLGTAPHGGYSLEALRARGHRLFVLGTDQWLMREAMSVQITKARSCLDASEHSVRWQ